MKNIIKLILVSLFILSCDIQSDDNSNIKGMTLGQYAKSDKFISFTDEEASMSPKISLEDSTAENHNIVFKTKASLYRFYRKCVYDKGLLIINVKNGAEINVSENIFSVIKNTVVAQNEFIIKYLDEKSKTKSTVEFVTDVTFFTEKGLETLLE